MGLGPSYCKVCMTLTGRNPTNSGRYWGCETCHTDDMGDNISHLFGCTDEELDMALKDHPEIRKIMREFRK